MSHMKPSSRKHPGILCWRKYAWYNNMEDSQTVSVKSANAQTFQVSNATSEHFPIYKDLHFSIICNSKKMETATNIGQWLNILWQIHTMVY